MRRPVAIAMLAIGLLVTTATGSVAGGGTRVIISTDLATGLRNGWRAGVSDIDDGLAVAMALADKSLDVLGVVAIFGNNDMEPAKLVGDRVVHDLMRSNVPVLRGAAAKLSDPQVAWYDGTPLYQGCLNESSLPVTFMTFSLTSSALVPHAALDPLRQNTSDLARFVVGTADPWIGFWHKMFNENGFHPWDQNAIYYAIRPSAFHCEPANVQIVSCPSAPYHKDDDNACAGHGPAQKASLDKESAQLWLSPGSAPRVKMCAGYASPEAKQEFVTSTFRFMP